MSASTFPNTQLYELGYCVIFAKGISPADLLARVSGEGVTPVLLSRAEADAIQQLGDDLDEGDIPELDMDELRENGMLDNDRPLVRAGTYGEWAFAVEPIGLYLAEDEILESASRGTAALSATLSDSAAAWIAYAEDGQILSSFDPLFPEQDHGTSPHVLEALTGYRAAIADGERADSYERALRKIQRELHCDVPQAADEDRMLAVRVAEED
ncbi:DUF6461 domain-containing protein [Streptomyces spectabilis]|uniref:Uncharacterized protein n=1 Tax=Streptomyces spectabilis TaxID=68270 RepID=A0A7W8B5V7_STRST|nr:DUF6461 domain-containing protein [Streptomyces spectabilis]MBB5109133.1 hypothetical protein [Streptomyces spectabilis]MCI3907698.1 DUF6461 domain-containing protein [Streptomyces spectabilis]GGV51038.1 hypothetical protein GCM10010245_80230 [Streptomyces spectabilis]